MPNLEAQLSSELSRIIASPYPVSLSNLAELLATGDDLTIRKCINDRPPCLITRLAGLVAAALPLWSFALSALQRLCCCLEFKEEFLLQNPTLLNTLITRAGASSCDFDKYFELCVLLLSDPLPDALPLPASAHAFFLRAFEHSTRSPCVGTLKPVYRMLNGACQGLLAHQPSETRDKFEKELLSLFSSDPTKQDSVLWLWCFGLVILAEYPEESGRMQSTSSILPPQTAVQRNDGSEKKWRTSAGRKLFGSAGSMLKTINLISLNVILACKANPGISDNEAMEGIRIAMKTLQAINVDVRQHWLDRSPLGKSVPAKLMGKLIGRDIHPGVQLHGICFLALLLNGQNLPHQLTSLYQKALLALPQLDLEPVDLRETLSASLTLFAPFLEQTAVQNLIQAALLAYIRPASLVELNAFQIMAQELTAAIPNFKALCSNILFTLSSNATQGTIREFLRAPALEEVHKHAAADSCETFTSGLRRNLALSIISMLLTSALTTQSEEFGLDQALVLALIKKQSQLSSSRTSCTHTMATSKPHPSISIFEQECTPAASGPYPKDWRERITSELERQSFYQRDTVIRTVAQICQDLENRCEHVEEPLREEKRRVVELQTKVRQLTDHISNLEAESMDRKMMIDGLEAERAQLETDLDRADESNQGLSAAMDQLKREFTDANKKAEETLQAAQQAFHARETEFQTTILNREEALQQRSKEIEELNNAIKHLEENSRNAESEIDNLATLRETLKGRIESVENDLDSERQFRSRATDDINRLKGSELDLTGRLQSCKAEVEHLKGQLEAQEERHRELMQASKEAQEALVSKYETELRVLAEQADEARTTLKAGLESALEAGREAKDAYAVSTRELKQKEHMLASLAAQVKELSAECSEKDQELEERGRKLQEKTHRLQEKDHDLQEKDQQLQELKAMRRTLLTNLGIAPTASPPPLRTSERRPDAPELSPQTPRHRRPRKSALKTNEDNATRGETVSDSAMNDSINASSQSSDSSRGGPTPKRPKHNRSFKVPTMRTPHGQKSGNSIRSAVKRATSPQRPALSDVSARCNLSPNRRHTTVGFAFADEDGCDEEVMAKTRRGSLHTLTQGSFNMSGIFTSTPFMPGNSQSGAGWRDEDEMDEETITEL